MGGRGLLATHKANRKTKSTHENLQPTPVTIPPISTSAGPFWWLLNENQTKIDESLPEPLPLYGKAPFKSSGIFGRERQEALSEHFFRQAHLGMFFRDDCRKSWEWKKDWYAKNGSIEGKNLFTIEDGDKGGMDSTIVKEVAEIIQSLI